MNVTFDFNLEKRLAQIKAEEKLLDLIRESFSIPNPAYAFRRGRYIPRRLYQISPSGYFDIGLFFEIRKLILKGKDYLNIYKTEIFRRNLTRSFNVSDPKFDTLSLKARKYQELAVRNCLQIGRGVVVVGTSGGKTLITSYLLENIFKQNKKMKCLFLVPTLDLVEQAADDFGKYGVSFYYSKWTSKNPLKLESNVIIGGMGILHRCKDKSWLNNLDLVIMDEVHQLKADNKISNIIRDIRTPHKFGLTGSMPNDDEINDKWNVLGKIGPVLYEKEAASLRKDNYITSDVRAEIIKIEYNNYKQEAKQMSDLRKSLGMASKKGDDPDKSKPYRDEMDWLAKNKYRNSIVSQLCSNMKNNALVLVDYIEHGEIIKECVSNKCPDKKVFFVHGDVDVNVRTEIKALMESSNNVIVVAISKIFSTGVSINNLHYICLAGGGKARRKIIQTIGRGLRVHKDKKCLIIIDIADQTKYGIEHLCKRQQIYKEQKISYGIRKITEKKRKEVI